MGVAIKGGRFLITGGLSLIGSHIAEHLLAEGAAEVVLLDNASLTDPGSLADLLAHERVTFRRGDVLSLTDVMEACEGIDGVFALAAMLTLPLSQRPALGIQVNVLGTLNVFEAVRWQGVKKVIFSSSVSAIGNAEDADVTEETPYVAAGLQPPAAIYGLSKLLGEQMGRLYAQRHGMEFIALRYSTVYGERQHYRGVNALYIIEAYDRIMAGRPPQIAGDGSEVHDYIYVGDIARANLTAMASDVSGESILICTGVATNLNRIVEVLLAETGSDLKPEYTQDAGGKVKFTASSIINYNRGKAERLLGWTPQVGIEEGIRRLIAWRRGQSA